MFNCHFYFLFQESNYKGNVGTDQGLFSKCFTTETLLTKNDNWVAIIIIINNDVLLLKQAAAVCQK